MTDNPFQLLDKLSTHAPHEEREAAKANLLRRTRHLHTSMLQSGDPQRQAPLPPTAYRETASTWLYQAERSLTEYAVDVVARAAYEALQQELLDQDQTGELVGVPWGSARASEVSALSSLIANELSPSLHAGDPLTQLLRQPQCVVVLPAMLPAGHPLSGIEPAVIGSTTKTPLIFINGSVAVLRERLLFPTVCSLSQSTYLTNLLRQASESAEAKARESRERAERQRQKEAREQNERAASLVEAINDPHGELRRKRLRDLEEQVALLTEKVQSDARLAELKEKLRAAQAAVEAKGTT